MSYTQLGYPAAFASEGNPMRGGGFPGDYDPYVHTVKDRMDVDDETGVFSIDVSCLAFAVTYVALISPIDWSGSLFCLLSGEEFDEFLGVDVC
jgi:leucyl aminopeptidase